MSSSATAARQKPDHKRQVVPADRPPPHEIPLAARTVAACDTFNAMTTTRSYRKALPVSAVIAELEVHAGTQRRSQASPSCCTHETSRRGIHGPLLAGARPVRVYAWFPNSS